MIALTATTITIAVISGFTSPLAQITVIASIRSNIITVGVAVAIFKGDEHIVVQHIVVQHVVVVDGLVLGVYHLIFGGGRILILGVRFKGRIWTRFIGVNSTSTRGLCGSGR